MDGGNARGHTDSLSRSLARSLINWSSPSLPFTLHKVLWPPPWLPPPPAAVTENRANGCLSLPPRSRPCRRAACSGLVGWMARGPRPRPGPSVRPFIVGVMQL